MRRVLVLSLLLAALLPSAAAAAPADLWATVNVCDTPRRPNAVGVRASMPGLPRGTALWMRFRIQYEAAGRWLYVTGADSGYKRVGRARGGAVESGWSFEFEPPAEAVTFRGVVRFQSRRGAVVVRRAREVTETGHRSTVGADPQGYSAATCSMA